MKFSIITPTYRRSEKLSHCVTSVLNQNYQDFEMVIINDSPDDTSYSDFEKNIKDNRIKYFKNEKNMGVNYSRNFALDNLSPDGEWVILLDDDDWLAENTLQTFVELSKKHSRENWFVCNRATNDGKSLTSYAKNNTLVNYAWDYLILKRFKGDATHCIKSSEVKNIRFSKKIKQGEEWFFFYQLGIKNRFFYSSYNLTLSDGYDIKNGLNFRKLSKLERIKNSVILFTEGLKAGFSYRPSFIIYIKLRTIRDFIR